MPRNRDYPDQRRAWALVWQPAEDPSPRAGLTVRRIVDAAIGIADADGLSALTMRRVADALGVGAMSLYTYVPGKDELVFLMIEAATGELPREGGEDAGWRERLEAIARSYWELHRRHPWLVDVPVTRPVVGPNGMDRWEYELRALDGIGLDELEMNGVAELVRRHVEGTARYMVQAERDAKRSGISDDEWWYSVLPVLERLLADRSYPVSTRVGEAIGAPHSDPEYIFDFGLARVLDGVELLVASRAGLQGRARQTTDDECTRGVDRAAALVPAVPGTHPRTHEASMQPRITVLTIGVNDLERSLRFYRDGLGFSTEGIVGREFEHGAVAFFDLQPGLRLALWPRGSIAHDAGVPLAPPSATELTLGHNVGSKQDVDAVMEQARVAGARIVKQAQDTFWGGYAGYFEDPDGHLWEVVWNPALEVAPP